jgi:hypothetical protein
LDTETKKAKSSKVDYEKSDVTEWPGGLPIDLTRKNKEGLTLEERLSKHIKEELDQEAENQSKLIEKIEKWQNLYKGKKKPKSKPWANSANVAVPLTRINIDTVHVRIVDAIFNRRRPFIVKAKRPEFIEIAKQVEDALDWLFTNVIKLRKKLVSPLLQQLKVGTAILYLMWVTKNRTIYRYANKEEIADKLVKKYKSGGSTPIVKDTQSIYEGPDIVPVPREDFIISSDATDIDDAYLCGFRKRYRKYEIDLNVKRGLWRGEAAEKILSPDKATDNEETRAANQSKELDKTDFSKPYEIWTLWISYDVDGDGEPDDIMVTFHKDTGAILKAIYSPAFTGQRPFVKLVGNPTEYAFDGEGFCEVMYSINEEVDTIHNQRLDRMSMINSLMTITKDGSGLENFKLELGKNWVTDMNPEEVFKEIKFSDQYPSTQMEEATLTQLGEKVTGNTPALQGQSLAERPVFKDTQALLAESNKKFKAMIDNIVAGLTESGYQTLELYAQYEPQITYKVLGKDGRWADHSVTLPITSIRDGLEISLAASSDVMSREARRELNQNLYMMTSDYLTKMASTAQALTDQNVPPEFKKFLLESGKVAARLFRDILYDSDRPDAEELAVDPGKIMDAQALLAPPPPPPPPQMPPGPPGPQVAPQGPPPDMGEMMGG